MTIAPRFCYGFGESGNFLPIVATEFAFMLIFSLLIKEFDISLSKPNPIVEANAVKHFQILTYETRVALHPIISLQQCIVCILFS